MKTQILNHDGKSIKEIEMPSFFSAKIREDIVSKVLEAMKKKQPYAPSPVAGKQHAAKGKIVHRRHVWRSGYGKGISRVPRKIFSRRGEQFNWEATEVPNAKGGIRAHPPKVLSMIELPKINKKEMKIAFTSALSSTANINELKKRYKTLGGMKVEPHFPMIISELGFKKTKDTVSAVKNILGNELFKIALPKKKIRSGKGKMRGRKYKTSAGLLIVLSDKEKINSNVFDVKKARELSLNDIELGRLTIYSEGAIKELGERINGK
ncbi:MAG: 50S ribosomal protein L4 [Nanoarchaeota archaeon]|nr:50S ribosomal protein L4 [Nanoarchaeota archaeon]